MFSTFNLITFMDLDTLLGELSSYNVEPTVNNKPILKAQTQQPTITDDNLNEYILRRAAALVDTSIDSVEELKGYVLQGNVPEEITALAELINASTRAVEALNKLNLQKRKFDDDVKLKHIDHTLKKELITIDTKPQTVNNNVFIASREEMFKKFINNNNSINNKDDDVEVVKAVIVDSQASTDDQ